MTEYLNNYNNPKIFMSSSRLYSNPSFLDGCSSIFNIGGNNFDYNYSGSSYLADNMAIKRDWTIIGQDLKYSINSAIK